MGETASVKRVAKNTMIMYIRMLVLVCISFYTSRKLLELLGVEDFGIYSVVGSVSTTFVALKSIFSESIQRFSNFAKGKSDLNEEQQVYTFAVKIHIILAFFVLVIVELFGMWLICNKLVIPVEKLNTAIFVFQMTMVSTFLSVLNIPFESVIIANEKMDVYAYIAIFDSFFQLAVIFLIQALPFTLLRSFSLLIVFIPASTLLFSFLYCRKFPECRFTNTSDKTLLKDIFSLSGWNFFGNISFSILHEGINFLLNAFGGLAYNTARGVAYQVKRIALQFSNNTVISARPMIMQHAAKDGDEALTDDIIEMSRVSFFILLLPVFPLVSYCHDILDIWLVDVPPYATTFTRLVLIGVLIRSLHEPLNMLYMAKARIKRMMIIEMVVMLSTILLIYIFLKIGLGMWVAFLVLSIMEIIIVMALLMNAKYELKFNVIEYSKSVLLPVVFIIFGLSILSLLLQSIMIPQNVFQCILYSLISLFIVILAICLNLNKKEKTLIKYFIKRKK